MFVVITTLALGYSKFLIWEDGRTKLNDLCKKGHLQFPDYNSHNGIVVTRNQAAPAVTMKTKVILVWEVMSSILRFFTQSGRPLKFIYIMMIILCQVVEFQLYICQNLKGQVTVSDAQKLKEKSTYLGTAIAMYRRAVYCLVKAMHCLQ